MMVKKNPFYILLGGAAALLLLAILSLTLKAQWTIQKMSAIASKENEYQLYEAFALQNEQFEKLSLPAIQSDRQNFLIVGMRGFGKQYGELLTDTIILLSIKKDANKAALMSIPRDLFVQIPYNGKVKINELYSLGYAKGGEKLAFNLVKTVVSQLSGVHIDGIARIDFDGFEKIIDSVGGVDVYLSEPFQENLQWQGEGGFYLPSGLNHLDGAKALYFVRSRFSTSDFDRARRQHLVIDALKEKFQGLGLFSNPIKIYAMLDIIGNHVKTDIPLSVSDILSLIKPVTEKKITHLVISTQNFLFSGTAENGSYILLPKNDSFDPIRKAIREIFTPEKTQSSLPFK